MKYILENCRGCANYFASWQFISSVHDLWWDKGDYMPTASKLFAAVFLALCAPVLMAIVVSVYPNQEWRVFAMTTTGGLVGFMTGWRGLGEKMKHDVTSNGYNLGFRAGVSVYLWTLLLFSMDHMMRGILRHTYYQPLDAVLQIPLKMVDYGYAGLHPKISLTVIGLSLLGGRLTKAVSMRWT